MTQRNFLVCIFRHQVGDVTTIYCGGFYSASGKALVEINFFPFKWRLDFTFKCSIKIHAATYLVQTSIVKTRQTNWQHHLPAYSCSKQGISPGWSGIQYTCLVGCRLPPLDGYVAVCLVLTIDVYDCRRCSLVRMKKAHSDEKQIRRSGNGSLHFADNFCPFPHFYFGLHLVGYTQCDQSPIWQNNYFVFGIF